jgi:hypothetical protein
VRVLFTLSAPEKTERRRLTAWRAHNKELVSRNLETCQLWEEMTTPATPDIFSEFNRGKGELYPFSSGF